MYARKSAIILLFFIGFLELFADIKGVEHVSANAPLWARANGVFSNMDETPFGGLFFENNKSIADISKEKFFPFIDYYGQFIHSNWNGKIHTDADFQTAIAVEKNFNNATRAEFKSDSFGGRIIDGVKFAPSRRFRLEKQNGKWFFVTPSGNLFWSLGVNAFAASSGTRVSGREHYFDANAKLDDVRYQEKLPYDKTRSTFFRFYDRNLDLKYGAKDKAIDAQIQRLENWGFNSLGAWANKEVAQKTNKAYFALAEYPRCEMIKCKNPRESLPDFFCDSFRTSVANNIKKLEADFANSMCIGIFVGYKMFWQNKWRLANLPKAVMSSERTQSAKLEFLKLLRAKYKNTENLNKAWSSSYRDWKDFLSVRDFLPNTKASKIDFGEFTLHYIEQYFKVCAEVIKERDSEMLFLGSRIPADTSELVLIAASKYCHAVSLADYPQDCAQIRLPKGSLDKPILICEFNFCAQDRGVFGGGYSPVKTTNLAAKKLESFVNSALKNPSIVGIHWMRWVDAPTSAKHNSENTASGLIDLCDTPIYPLISVFKNTSTIMYKKRLAN